MDVAILSQFWIYREENARQENEATCKNRSDFTIIQGQNSKEDRKVSDEALNGSESVETASRASRTDSPFRNLE